MLKRVIFLFSAFLLLLCSLFTILAAADDTSQNAVTFSWDGCEPSGEYMLFFLNASFNSGTISSDDILFADQLTAGSDGGVSVLYLNPEFDACQIWMSGIFPDGGSSPRMVGSYETSPSAAIHTPAALSEIEEEAFAGGNFTHVYLSENVTTIGKKAFSDCSSLQYIEIPAMVVTIADDAFSNSPDVTIGCRANSDAYRFAVAAGIPYRIIEG